MARTRSIWPEFFSNADLAGLSPLHRILYAGLPTQCDWQGRGDDKPGDLKIRLLPLDAVDGHAVDVMMADLERVGLLRRYQVDGHRYFEISHEEWRKQHPHVDEKKKPARPECPPGTVPAPGLPGLSTGVAPDQNAYLLSLVSDHDHLSLSASRCSTGQQPPADVGSWDDWPPAAVKELTSRLRAHPSKWASFVLKAASYPKEQRLRGAAAFLDKKKPEEGGGIGLLLKMIQDGDGNAVPARWVEPTPAWKAQGAKSEEEYKEWCEGVQRDMNNGGAEPASLIDPPGGTLARG